MYIYKWVSGFKHGKNNKENTRISIKMDHVALCFPSTYTFTIKIYVLGNRSYSYDLVIPRNWIFIRVYITSTMVDQTRYYYLNKYQPTREKQQILPRISNSTVLRKINISISWRLIFCTSYSSRPCILKKSFFGNPLIGAFPNKRSHCIFSNLVKVSCQ